MKNIIIHINKIKNSLLKQNDAVQPITLEHLINRLYINNINIKNLKFNLFLIKCMLTEINIFKNLYNHYTSNQKFDIRNTIYFNVEDVVKIRSILNKMKFLNNIKGKNFLIKVVFYHMIDLYDGEKIP